MLLALLSVHAATVDLNAVLATEARRVQVWAGVAKINRLSLDGRYGRALDVARRTREHATGIPGVLGRGFWPAELSRVRAALALEQGELAEANEAIRDLRAHLDGIRSEEARVTLEAHALLLEAGLARVDGAGGPGDGGAALVARAEARLFEAGLAAKDTSLAYVLLLRYAETGRTREAAALADAWAPRTPVGEVSTQILAADALAAVGRTDEARTRLEAVLALAERRRWALPAAAAHGALARIYDDGGAADLARTHADAALGLALQGDAWPALLLALQLQVRRGETAGDPWRQAEAWLRARPALERLYRVPYEAEHVAWLDGAGAPGAWGIVAGALARDDLARPPDAWARLLALGVEAVRPEEGGPGGKTQPGAALADLSRALASVDPDGLAPPTRVRLHVARARLASVRGEDPAQAWTDALDAAELVASAALGGPEERSLARRAGEAVDALVALRMGQGDWLGAVEAMERGRARAVAAWLGAAGGRGATPKPTEEERDALRAEQAALDRVLAALLSEGRDVVPLEGWEALRAASARVDAAAARARVAAGTPEVPPQPLDRAALAALPGPGERFVAWHLTADAGWVVAWDQQGATGARLDLDLDAARRLADDAGQRLRARPAPPDPYPDASVLGPPSLFVGASRLVLLPHGPLHAFPFGALATAEGPLGARVAWTTAPSASVLAARRAGLAPLVVRTSLTVGDPSGDLAFARKDTRETAWPGEVVRVVGGDAAEGGIVARMAGADLVHLATHGGFVPGAPRASFLLLAPGPGADGRLMVREIEQLRLRAGLVVLSACSTGRYGDVTPEAGHGPADDLLGLPVAFLAAGAQRVLSTLWPVDDAEASAFTAAFARELVPGAPLPDVLRRTVARLRADGAPPSVWAAYVLHDPEAP